MRVEPISQIDLGSIRRIRIGDVLNKAISDDVSRRFKFAVAYLRVSGLDRLSVSLEALLNRGGSVSGSVGIDDSITSVEALMLLQKLSPDSTIFYTTSGYIYHPKVYLIEGESSGVAVIGSANLTRDGLFRNVEFATAVYLDFKSGTDLQVYKRYDSFINELLNQANPNVQVISPQLIEKLSRHGLIKSECEVEEPGPALRPARAGKDNRVLADLFPPLRVPPAPPGGRHGLIRSGAERKKSNIVVPPVTTGVHSTFIMQLSSFDSSHRSGIPGTSEILIPHSAVSFFPRLLKSGRKYPDTLFDVVLNTLSGRERHRYRLWYYEERATGTRIDEYRLRMNHDTIDLSTFGGGDLLVINRLAPGSDPLYEVTILPQADPTYPAFFAQCTLEAQGKKWGLI